MFKDDRGFMNEGACRPDNRGGYPASLWFPEAGQRAAKAKRICNTECPVRDQCAEYALHFPLVLTGVWGGMTRLEIRDKRLVLGIRAEREEYFSGLPLDASEETAIEYGPDASARNAH